MAGLGRVGPVHGPGVGNRVLKLRSMRQLRLSLLSDGFPQRWRGGRHGSLLEVVPKPKDAQRWAFWFRRILKVRHQDQNWSDWKDFGVYVQISKVEVHTLAL